MIIRIKLILYIAIAFLVISECRADNKVAYIKGKTSADFIKEPQWAYLFSVVVNEVYLLDSAFMSPDKLTFDMKAKIEGDEDNTCIIVFEKAARRQTFLRLLPGEILNIEFINGGYPKVSGSKFTEDYYKWRNLALSRINAQDFAIDSTYKVEIDAVRRSHVIDSIEQYYRLVRINDEVEKLKSRDNPSDAITTLKVLKAKFGLTNADIEPWIAMTKSRFPNDFAMQAYPDEISTEYPPTSAQGLIIAKRMNDLVARRTPKVSLPQRIADGERVDNFQIKDIKGDMVSLNDIKTPYILIDFWAAWCVPCRKEVPYLKEALKQYGDSLTILAISIDDKEEQWLKAVESDSSFEFTHVRLGNDNDAARNLKARFGVSSIPANFLLDSGCKIVATGLRQQALVDKMNELTHE